MYRYKVTKTYNYYGPPQAERHYLIEGDYFTAKIKYFGNQGFDAPQVTRIGTGSGYFWSLNTFMRAFYKEKLGDHFANLKEGESRTFQLEHFQY